MNVLKEKQKENKSLLIAVTIQLQIYNNMPIRVDYCGRISLTTWYVVYIRFEVTVNGE
jgi:hypothetical protein